MIRTKSIQPLSKEIFSELGWDYYLSEEADGYLAREMVKVSEKEADQFCNAGNLLYNMFVDAADHVLRNNLLGTLGIPENLNVLINYSWENDNHFHLYGRFDFAGGLDGAPLKILEFNADTPTTLPETAIIQWLQLKANHIPEDRQVNFIYDALMQNFQRLARLNPDKEKRILFSALEGAPEDHNNVALMMEAAKEAGFEVAFETIDKVIFSEFDGIFAEDDTREPVNYPFWFKLVPWEYIAWDEPELAEILTRIVIKEKAVVVNPAYTMLFQSKAILKYLWELFPEHDYLLKTAFSRPSDGKSYVEKAILGREGANVRIISENGETEEEEGGEYESQMKVFQEYTPLQKDFRGNYYQAGLFFIYETCGLGFRLNQNRILNNAARFAGHFID